MAVVVNNCCFCADLRSGSYVIGFLNLVWSIGASIMFIILIIAAIASQIPALSIIFALYLTIYVIRIVFIILLLVGLHTYNRRFVMAFIIFKMIFTGLNIVLFIVAILFGTTILNIIINVFDILLSIYFLIVIRSYHLTMDQTNPANQPTMYQQPQQFPMQLQQNPMQTQQYPMQTQQYPMPTQQYPMQDVQYPNQSQQYPTHQHDQIVMARQEKQQV